MKYTFLILLLISLQVRAQYTFSDPVSGKAFDSQKYSGINGSPFLSDAWMEGVAYSGNIIFKNLKLKFDVNDNLLYFEAGGGMYEFREGIDKFALMPDPKDSSSFIHFRNNYKIPGVGSRIFLQTIVAGKITLLKLYGRSVSEMSQINAGMIKTFTPTVKYFFKVDDNIHPIRLSTKEISPYFGSLSQAVKDYIKENNLSLKKEEDVRLIVTFFNKKWVDSGK